MSGIIRIVDLQCRCRATVLRRDGAVLGVHDERGRLAFSMKPLESLLCTTPVELAEQPALGIHVEVIDGVRLVQERHHGRTEGVPLSWMLSNRRARRSGITWGAHTSLPLVVETPPRTTE